MLLFLSGCGKDEKIEQMKSASTIDVYTTVYPLQYFTEQIGGEYVNVKSIYPPGTDEHTYEPSQKDMMNLADADLFFYIGLGLEGFAQKAESILKNNNVTMIAVGERLDIKPVHHEEDEEHHGDEHDSHEDHEHDGHTHGDIDPHVWLDPIYAKGLAEQILHELSEKRPKQKELFEKNYEELANQFAEIDTEFKEAVEDAKRKKIVVSHAAYGYWEQRYGIEQVAIAGISTAEEPSQKKLKDIVDLVKKEQVPYILYEQNTNSKLANVIKQETNTEALMLHNLGVLSDKELQEKANYFTLMKRNTEVLKKALN